MLAASAGSYGVGLAILLWIVALVQLQQADVNSFQTSPFVALGLTLSGVLLAGLLPVFAGWSVSNT